MDYSGFEYSIKHGKKSIATKNHFLTPMKKIEPISECAGAYFETSNQTQSETLPRGHGSERSEESEAED